MIISLCQQQILNKSIIFLSIIHILCYIFYGDIMYIGNNKYQIEIKEASTFFQKLKGFMGQKNINNGLRFKTNGIHTFFMKEKIDVILTDKKNTIKYLFKSLSKNKIILPKKNIYYTYELPKNTINKLNLKTNTTLKIKNDIK